MNSLLNIYYKYKEAILYLVFGVLTTIVSFLTFYICSNILNIHYLVSNIISWIFAVTFAYITNRIFVFESKFTNIKNLIREIFTFVNCRLLSGLIDMLIMFLLVSALKYNDLYAKLFTQVIIVILNYIFSKLIIFREAQNEK